MSKDSQPPRTPRDESDDPLRSLSKLPLQAIAPLRKLLRAYDGWIVQNAEYLGYMESTLRALVFILPKRNPTTSQLETELAYSGVSLLSLYHDLVIIRFFSKHPQHSHTLRQKIHQSVGRFRVTALLTALSNSELVLELLAARFWNTKGRWMLCIAIESLKAALRLWVLSRNGGCMLIQQTLPARDTLLAPVDPARGLQPLRQSTPTPAKMAGEILYIMRPLVYLTALMMRGRRSWLPWVLSLAIDVSSRTLLTTGLQSAAEKDELARRTVQWCYYFLRSPFFEYITNSDWFQSMVNAQPIVSLKTLLASFAQYILTYRRNYFYTAGSS